MRLARKKKARRKPGLFPSGDVGLLLTSGRFLGSRRVEEQGLPDRRLHRFRLEGLGDQKSKFKALPGQQTLWEGGDEDDRHVVAGRGGRGRGGAGRAGGRRGGGRRQA